MKAGKEHMGNEMIFRKMVFPEDRDYLFEIHRIYGLEYGLSHDTNDCAGPYLRRDDVHLDVCVSQPQPR